MLVPVQVHTGVGRVTCATQPVELFFGPEGETRAERDARELEAVAVCRGCAVREVCLVESMTWPITRQYGVFGGLTAQQRREVLRRQRRRTRAQLAEVRRRAAEVLAAAAAGEAVAA